MEPSQNHEEKEQSTTEPTYEKSQAAAAAVLRTWLGDRSITEKLTACLAYELLRNESVALQNVSNEFYRNCEKLLLTPDCSGLNSDDKLMAGAYAALIGGRL